jgi:hypothetical protein
MTGALFPKKLFKETDLFDNSIRRVTSETRYLLGYFRNFSMVSTVCGDLLNRFAGISETFQTEKLNLSEALAVHIRCGDYRTNDQTKKSMA